MRHREGSYYQIPNREVQKRFPNNDPDFARQTPFDLTATEKNEYIQQGFFSLGRPTRPSFDSSDPGPRKDHTMKANHWKPLGRGGSLGKASLYLSGPIRRPGGSVGRGHYSR